MLFSSEDKLSASMAKQTIKSLLLLMLLKLNTVEEDSKIKLQFPCDEPKKAAIGAMPFSFQQMETETFGLKHHA